MLLSEANYYGSSEIWNDCCPIKLFGYFALATQNKRPWAKVIILADSRSRTMPKWTKRLQKIGKSSSARQPMPRPSPHSSTEWALKSKKTDSTTAKTIAEAYIVASVNFYRTAVIKYMNSDAFAPSATLDWNEMNRLVQKDGK